MKRIIFSIVCITLGFHAIADVVKANSKPEKKVLTDSEKAELREKRLMKTGGSVTQEGKGKIVVVNAQQKYPLAVVEKSMSDLRRLSRMNLEVRPGAWKFGEKIPADASIAMFVIDDGAFPMSLVAMEAKWGVVNVSSLQNEQQVERELMRVAVATFGGGVSQYKISPMQPVFSPEDLDAMVGVKLTIDAGNAIIANLQKIGMTRSRVSTYRKACMEGWAPAPTNKYQKAVWDDVHTLPSQPLKLTK